MPRNDNPSNDHPSRRLILAGGIAAGGLIAAPPRLTRAQEIAPTPECRDDEAPTQSDIEGPYFKPRSPERAALVERGTRGQLYRLEGFVLTRSCRPIPGAVLDLWHADENGDYDNDGFRYRGHMFAAADGRYRFDTILPGLYPGRTRHYHLKVAAPGGRLRLLTTQLYFPGENRNFEDCCFDPILLVRVASGAGMSTARFDFVLNMP